MKTASHAFRRASILVLLATTTAAIAGFAVPSRTDAQAEAGRTMPSGSDIPLAPDAPDRYVVKSGDTLWDIAQVFLRDAWYWPEIWYVNPQIENPHLIYPGDILTLVYVEGRPQVRVERGGGAERLSPRIREEELSQAIHAIPYEVIEAFTGRPTVLDKDQVKSAPYLVAMRDQHLIGAVGNEVYARRVSEAAADTRYNIIHVGAPLVDPEDGDLLGYRGLYVGAGAVAAPGDPAKLILTSSSREALQGDKLFPETVDVGLDFVPHAPAGDVNGEIIAVDGVSMVGQYQIIAINRGQRHGLEPGHVVAIYQRGGSVKDVYSHGGLSTGQKAAFSAGSTVELPDERVGVAMLFRTYDRMSYGLIMEATHPVRIADRIRNP